MMINGVWEVPTMIDLHEQGKLFEWGAVELPVIFDHPATYADSHTFAIPANQGAEMSPEKRAAVLEVICWIAQELAVLGDRGSHPGLRTRDRVAPSTRRWSRTRPIRR